MISKVVFTGASRGLGAEVWQTFCSLPERPSTALTAGRSPSDDLDYSLGKELPLDRSTALVHFAWERGDLSANSKNIEAIKVLAKSLKNRLIFISTETAGLRSSIYAEQKYRCESIVTQSGGVVVRIGTTIDAESDAVMRVFRTFHKFGVRPAVPNSCSLSVTSLNEIARLIERLVHPHGRALSNRVLTVGAVADFNQLSGQYSGRFPVPIPIFVPRTAGAVLNLVSGGNSLAADRLTTLSGLLSQKA